MTTVEEAQSSLRRVQQIDPKSVIRREDLGVDLNFEPAEEAVGDTVNLFLQIPVEQLGGLSLSFRANVDQCARAFLALVDEMLKFKTTHQNAADARQNLIDSARTTFENYFSALHPVISYIGSQQKNFAALERDARARIQEVLDGASEASKTLDEQKIEAAKILEEVKKVAEEQGVSQMAYYFRVESENYSQQAAVSKRYVIILSVMGILYLIASLFIRKIPIFSPTNSYESLQLAISKTLIFAVIVYLLVLSARNFLSHQHNSIVNRHRQNSLLTYRALTEAAGTQEKRDIVLAHAAACIFSPQDTGYTKGAGHTNVTGLVESIAKVMPPASPAS